MTTALPAGIFGNDVALTSAVSGYGVGVQVTMSDGTTNIVAADTSADYILRSPAGVLSRDIRSTDIGRINRHGVVPGEDWGNPRQVALDLFVRGGSAGTVNQRIQNLLRVWEPVQSGVCSLAYRNANGGSTVTRLLFGRTRRVQVEQNPTQRFAHVVAEFVATDPRHYDVQVTGGMAHQVLAFSGLQGVVSGNPISATTRATGVTGIPLTNSGNTDAPWRACLLGPLINPMIMHAESGKVLKIAADVPDGGYLYLDSEVQSISRDGTVGGYGSLFPWSKWFDLQPGTNTIHWHAENYPTGTNLYYAFRNAYC